MNHSGQWDFEVTDTFGGEANYSWVRRETVMVKAKSKRGVVRALKAFAGFTGVRCEVSDYGDQISVRPIGRHAVLHIAFATWHEA